MPKIKTKRGAAKRLKLTATGRLKFRRAYRNHILTKKSPKLKRQQRPLKTLAPSDIKSAKQMLN